MPLQICQSLALYCCSSRRQFRFSCEKNCLSRTNWWNAKQKNMTCCWTHEKLMKQAADALGAMMASTPRDKGLRRFNNRSSRSRFHSLLAQWLKMQGSYTFGPSLSWLIWRQRVGKEKLLVSHKQLHLNVWACTELRNDNDFQRIHSRKFPTLKSILWSGTGFVKIFDKK